MIHHMYTTYIIQQNINRRDAIQIKTLLLVQSPIIILGFGYTDSNILHIFPVSFLT